MKSIRFGTFETNSSSCHSVSIVTTPRKIAEFNEGKRWYYASYDNESGLYTLEELYKIIKGFIDKDNLESFSFNDVDSYYGTEYTSLFRDSYSSAVMNDYERIKKYFIKNFSMELMRFALTDEENDKFISKYMMHSLINCILASYGYVPAMSKDEMLNTDISFNCSEYGKEDASGVWGRAKSDPNGIYTFGDCSEDENIDKEYEFIADIRDN